MAAYVGKQLTTYITLMDASSTPILGATFSTTLLTPDDAPLSITTTEMSGGVYRFRFIPAASGTHYLRVDYAGPPPQQFEESWDIDPRAEAPSPGGSGVGTDRLTLRRRILLELGDGKVLRATANGTNGTFIDAINLIGEPNAYIDRQVLFTGGTPANLGVVNQVNGSSKNTRAISFAVSLPADTVTGDECEMINTRGVGYTFADVHQAINAAIADAARESTVLATSDVTFDNETGSIAVPDTWSVFSGIQWQDSSGNWRGIVPARRIGGSGWSIDRVTRTIHIGGNWGYQLNGMTARITGAMDPEPINADTDATSVNPDWLVAEAAAVLLQGKYLLYGTPQAERAYQALRQKANQLRVFTVTRRLAGSVRLT